MWKERRAKVKCAGDQAKTTAAHPEVSSSILVGSLWEGKIQRGVKIFREEIPKKKKDMHH